MDKKAGGFSQAAVNARASMAANARPPASSPQVKAAAAAIVSARMTGAGVQPQTVAAGKLKVKAVEHVAIVVDTRLGVKVERSEVTALFNSSSCALMRLADEELVDAAQVKAALRFAWAGNRVLGEVRVRTVDLDRIVGLGAGGANAAEIDAEAKDDWTIARIRLMAAEFRILDGVMRHDEPSGRAAAFAYPNFRDRKKLGGMGDQAIISATDKLAFEYGYKADNERVTREIRLR